MAEREDEDDIPVTLDAPGAKARQSADFGSANGVLSAEGLEQDLCQASHWGYVLEGEVVVTYGDSSSETCRGGDMYHWPAGHTVRVVDDAELVMFSPKAAHGQVIEHIAAKIAAQG